MSFGTIVLIHLMNAERKTVPVETVTKTYLSIRWGQSGIYDLNLAKNVLTARSQKAQRKGKAHWKAEDINAVRKMVKDHLRGEDIKEETRRAMKRHEATMPVPNASIRHASVEEILVAPPAMQSYVAMSKRVVCTCKLCPVACLLHREGPTCCVHGINDSHEFYCKDCGSV